jgi:hypothetical protein
VGTGTFSPGRSAIRPVAYGRIDVPMLCVNQ